MDMLNSVNYVKTVVVGNGSVGKTCMLLSYATNQFPTEHNPTVFDNYSVNLTVADFELTLAIFDTAGQEEFDRLRLLSYPGTDIFLVCFAVNMPVSFEDVKDKWIPELKDQSPGIPFILVGTKVDTRTEKVTLERLAKKKQKPVTTEQGRKLAKKLGAVAYCECSAATQTGLKEVFDAAATHVLNDTAPKQRTSCLCLR